MHMYFIITGAVETQYNNSTVFISPTHSYLQLAAEKD